MFWQLFTQTLSIIASQLQYQGRKYGPDILMGVGVIGSVGSTVLACRATLKAKEVVDETKEKVEQIHETIEEENLPQEQANKELTSVYVKAGTELAKLYAPAAIVGGLSITSMVSSHKILTDRGIAAAAAYTALSQSFEEYRKRVAKKVGSDVENDIHDGIEEMEVDEVVVDENGKKRKVKKKKRIQNEVRKSELARRFTDKCYGWSSDRDLGRYHLDALKKLFEYKRKEHGVVFLNEVYEELGYPKTKLGNIYGWFYDPNNPQKYPEVSFGISKSASQDFIDGSVDYLWLNFNAIDILNAIPDEYGNQNINDFDPDPEEVAA